jgi:hypothetical protein
MTPDEIRNFISSAKLDEAIEGLKQLAQINGDKSLANNIILQSGRHRENERQKRMGLVDDSTYGRIRNQITYALLEYLGEAEGAAAPAPVVSNQPSSGTGQTGNIPSTGAGDGGVTTILFLASNPTGTGELQLNKEHSRISTKIQDSINQHLFRIRPKRAVTLSEFQEYLVTEKPKIVHFSGHGAKGEAEIREMIHKDGRDLVDESIPEKETGIILYDEDKRSAFFVNTKVIQRIFKSLVDRLDVPVKIVLFNSCYSESQADAIAQIVPYVIGTTSSVKDEAAIAFATGFYFAIAQGLEVEDAVDMGINNAIAFNEPEDRFILYKDGKKVEWH